MKPLIIAIIVLTVAGVGGFYALQQYNLSKEQNLQDQNQATMQEYEQELARIKEQMPSGTSEMVQIDVTNDAQVQAELDSIEQELNALDTELNSLDLSDISF